MPYSILHQWLDRQRGDQEIQILLDGMLVFREEIVENDGEFGLLDSFVRYILQSFLCICHLAQHILAIGEQEVLLLRDGFLRASDFQLFSGAVEIPAHLEAVDEIVGICSSVDFAGPVSCEIPKKVEEAADDAKEAVEEAADDAKDAAEDVKDAAEEAADSAADAVNDAAEDAGEALDQAGAAVEEAAEDAAEKAEEAIRAAKEAGDKK